MSMKAAPLHDTIITSGGPTQDFTLEGFGTPIGYMVWATIATAEATDTSDVVTSEGLSDGTNHYCTLNMSEDAQVASDTARQADSGSVVILRDAASNSVIAEAQHSTFIEDGVRLSWSTVPSSAYRIQILLFGGPDLRLEVGNENFDQAINTTKDVTLTGAFQPDLVFMLGHAGNLDNNNIQNHMKRNVGAGDGTNIGNIGSQGRHNQGTSATRSWSLDDRINSRYGNQLNIQGYLHNLVMLSDGFRLSKAVGDSNNMNTGYMALQSDTNKMAVETFASPSATGVTALDLTDPTLKPQCAIFVGSVTTTLGIAVDQGFSMGFFDDTRQTCMSHRDEDGQTTTSGDSRWDENVLYIQNGASTVISEAVFHSFQRGRISLNYTTTNATPRRHMMIVFGADDGYSTNMPR